MTVSERLCVTVPRVPAIFDSIGITFETFVIATRFPPFENSPPLPPLFLRNF